jgi:hypothetical protein
MNGDSEALMQRSGHDRRWADRTIAACEREFFERTSHAGISLLSCRKVY